MHRGYIYANIPQFPSFYKYLYPEFCRCSDFYEFYLEPEAKFYDLRKEMN